MFFLKTLLQKGGQAAAKKFQDEEKPFLEHLEDLRVTLMKVLITLGVSTVLAFVFHKQLIGIINLPLIQANYPTELLVLSPFEGFMSVFKICLYAGLICSFPIILYFIGEFIIPGLTEKEKKLVLPVVLLSFLLFATGVLFAYFVVIPRALTFFQEFNASVDIKTDLRFKYTVSFVTMMCLVFGLCFELPVVVLTLVKLDLLNSKMMRATRSYAIVAMFVLAALVTPTPDIFTMSLLAGPMILLYEICIWLAWWMERRAARREAAEKERERKALIERQKREKQRSAAREADAERAVAEGEAATLAAAAGTVPYSPDNEASFDGEGDEEDDGDDGGGASADGSGGGAEYHTGLGDVGGEPGGADEGDDSDAVWGYQLADSDHVEDPYHHHGENAHDDPYHHDDPHHYDHGHYDHHHYDHDYYSGPVEELKRTLREELKEDLKELIKAELRGELRAELKAELLAELRPDDASGGT